MSARLRYLGAVVVLALISEGCAARARVREYRARLAQADLLTSAGCYRCLKQAFAVYETLLAADFQREQVLLRAYDTALLIAAREKELGLPATPWIEQARRLPIAAARGDDATLLLDVTRGLPWNRDRFGPESRTARTKITREARKHAATWYAALSDVSRSSPAAAYMRIALACEYRSDIPDAQDLDLTAILNAQLPLLLYRVGACDREYRSQLVPTERSKICGLPLLASRVLRCRLR